ncbi:glycosyltransferase family 4 protein [Thermaerobacter subterraneus]|uniref:Glycosyltransferase n=1 Tax=Thermaerobacter subterraneus DSM 13965 TaxID=867903 RepID=K6QCE6_9FIRM|nr:glycosyltransferase family 4 protein [Thermaerobacter subterraneus]EKP94181.1 glycosyltransferase [Thermaerobacter subterraneus DSM 13965]
MRIVLATSYQFPHQGGLSTHVELLSRGLAAQGHEVRILSFNNFPPLHHVATRGPSWVLNRLRRGWGTTWSSAMRARFLTHLLRREAGWLDALNVEDPMAAVAAQRAGLPYVYTVHGYATGEHLAARRIRPGTRPEAWHLDLERRALAGAAHVVTVDERLRRHVEQLGAAGRVTVIPNFVDGSWPDQAPPPAEARRRLGIPDGVFVVLCPRRLTPKNGVAYAVQAMAAVRDGRVPWPEGSRPLLLVVGHGPQWAELRAAVQGGRLDDLCRLEGGRPHEAMPAYYAAADAVVIPSVHEAGVEEATSISALEAMVFGRPVVASAVGGLKEIVRDGVTGRLVPDRNPLAIARALAQLAAEPARARALGAAGRDYVLEHHSHLAAARRFVELYRRWLG